ncbi:hypothetical protein CCAX7_64500 [Capsulimonas corticalis]|uniref:Uncharacterized protein n=1 Tax=Capsulimonas corticalis TaxID=2219043 RepID=A0A402CQV4_9BACT|nr:chromate transporter [Capsulimonas corticalis]BDI34399.1 hypothetical protein CCAX7_64500 [Capsulimonas corticalis]
MNALVYFWIFLKASLFSTGGSGNLPSIHADMLARGWASDGEFGESLTIGQISPGPSGLWVICLGYLTDGLRGTLLALLAILLPPMLIMVIERLYRRIQHHPAVEGFVRGLGLAVVGVFLVAMFGILHSVGVSPRTLTITLAAIGLAMTRRVPVIAIVGIAGLVGVVWR